MQTTLEVFEKMLNQHKGDYLVNENPTIADLQLFFELLDLTMVGISFEKHVAIQAWHDKMANVPEVQQVQKVHLDAVAPFAQLFKQ